MPPWSVVAAASATVVLHDGLDDADLLEGEEALLASVSALLDTAERKLDTAAGAVAQAAAGLDPQAYLSLLGAFLAVALALAPWATAAALRISLD